MHCAVLIDCVLLEISFFSEVSFCNCFGNGSCIFSNGNRGFLKGSRHNAFLQFFFRRLGICWPPNCGFSSVALHSRLRGSLSLSLLGRFLNPFHDCGGLIFLGVKELLAKLLVFFLKSDEILVFLQVKALDVWLDIFLLYSGIIEKYVVAAQLFNLDNRVDHLWGYALGAHDPVHFLHGSELRFLEELDRVKQLLTAKLLNFALSHCIFEFLHLIFVE